jgi:hypothetical protein
VTTSPTFGPVDPLETTIRYTSLDAVKKVMGVYDTALDAQATQSIVTFEYMMDAYMNRSFPDPAPDGEIQGIPESVKQAALQGSVKIWRMLSDAYGAGGSDDVGFIGTFDTGQAARIAFNSVRPLLAGFRAPNAWGVA